MRTVSRGTNLSAFLLTPPPRIMRFGHIELVDPVEVLVEIGRPGLPGQAALDPRGRGGAPLGGHAADLHLAELGVRDEPPSMNTPDPTPVPRVRKMTTPGLPRPIPKRISAIPAASASLMIVTGRPITGSVVRRPGSRSTPDRCCAADLSAPSMVTPGRPTPTGVASPRPLDLASRLTTRATEASTASGVDGWGVATRMRSDRNRPARRRRRPP